MRLFFDTSALVKYYYEERGSEHVTKLIQDENLEIAITEFPLSLNDYIIEPFTSIVRENAEKIIVKYGKGNCIRTLDAMQLSTYILIADTESKFVCADNNLNKIAVLSSCQCINFTEY